MVSKQERYEELCRKTAIEEGYTDEEMTECTQLHYELDPKARKQLDGLTPQQVWGIDTSKYSN